MGAAPGCRPSSRWQLVHRMRLLPTYWLAYLPGSSKISRPLRTTLPNSSSDIGATAGAKAIGALLCAAEPAVAVDGGAPANAAPRTRTLLPATIRVAKTGSEETWVFIGYSVS